MPALPDSGSSSIVRPFSLALAVATFVLVLAASTSPADAHPILLKTLPQAGYSYAEAPSQIGVVFDEPVTVRDLTVRGQARGRIATSTPSRSPAGTTVTATPDAPLQDGNYTVYWQITASDGDLVDGTFTFGVGVAPDGGGQAATSETIEPVTTTVLRWFLFAGLALAAGGVVGDAIVRDRIKRARQERGLELDVIRPWVLGGSIVGLGSAVVLAWVQVGQGFSFPELASSAPGRVLIVETVGFLIAALAGWRSRPRLALLALVPVIGAEAFRSHLQTRFGLLGALTIGVHLGVAAFWIGALVHLVRTGLRWRANRRQVVVVFRRYARYAFGGYVLVLGTGTVAAIMFIPSWGALTSTTYGRILLMKLAAVVVVTTLALAARWGLKRPMSIYRWRGLRMARFEPLALAGVLLGSAALTATAPFAASADSALPPPVPEPAIYVGGLAGQVSAGVIASDGVLQVRLNVPEADVREVQRYRLRGTARDPNGQFSRLRLKPCGSSCYSSAIRWQDGETKIRLSIRADGWAGGTLDLAVPWPPRDGQPVLERTLATMARQPRVRIAEEVTSNTTRPEGMSSRLTVSGAELLDAQPYRAGIVSRVTILDRDRGITEIAFALPAESIYVRLRVNRTGRIRAEQISSANHLVTRTYTYPETRSNQS